ncbi:hypothetical protein R3I94_008804 [Phoxinus phoxinus]
MDQIHYMLFKGPKRVSLREEDMTTNKFGTIFQVSPPTVFLTDASNMAVFPSNNEYFSTIDLVPRGQYEVHGAASEALELSPHPQPQPRFAFSRQSASATTSSVTAGIPPRATQSKSYQRSVFMAEFVHGKLQPSRMIVIRFMEGDATVQGVLTKVQDALGAYDPLVLTDGQGNEILDSEGTRGSIYWKQNARKILAVPEQQFADMKSGKRRRSTRKDDESMDLQGVYDKIEEVVMAAQSLHDVTQVIKNLSELAIESRKIYVLMETQAEHVRAAFSCSVCKGPVKEPILSKCCRAIIGCKSCIDHSLQTSTQCVMCRADNFAINIVEVSGLSEALNALEIIKVD